jgi:hypothetical protein
MSKPSGLVATRLANMSVTHPAQDNSHVCSQCGERVGIYPSGMEQIRKHPGMDIICVVCALKDANIIINKPAASWDVIRQEVRDSVPVKKA